MYCKYCISLLGKERDGCSKRQVNTSSQGWANSQGQGRGDVREAGSGGAASSAQELPLPPYRKISRTFQHCTGETGLWGIAAPIPLPVEYKQKRVGNGRKLHGSLNHAIMWTENMDGNYSSLYNPNSYK